MTAIRIVRQGKPGKTDRLPLYLEFYINREKIRIAVKLSVTSKEWDVFFPSLSFFFLQTYQIRGTDTKGVSVKDSITKTIHPDKEPGLC